MKLKPTTIRLLCLLGCLLPVVPTLSGCDKVTELIEPRSKSGAKSAKRKSQGKRKDLFASWRSQKTLKDAEKNRKPKKKRKKQKGGYGGYLDRFSGGPSVQIFVSEQCGYCDDLEKFLTSRNIEYKRTDVNERSWRNYIDQEVDFKELPVTRVGSEYVVGYLPHEILRKLRQAGYEGPISSRRF